MQDGILYNMTHFSFCRSLILFIATISPLTFDFVYDMLNMLGRFYPLLVLWRFFMKKIIAMLLAIIAILSITLLSGCNKQIMDLTYSYEYAIIGLPNGEVVEGKVSSWTDYEDGDQLQVKINGKTYLVHSSNVVLISN